MTDKIKRIAYVDDIHAEGVNGLPLYFGKADDYNTISTTVSDHPVKLTQIAFLLERSNDPKLVEGLEPYEASRLRFFLRKDLRAQVATAKERGGYDIKGESTYDRLRKAIMNPEQKLVLEPIRFNYFPFEESVCDAATVTVEAIDPPVTNGAHAQAS